MGNRESSSALRARASFKFFLAGLVLEAVLHVMLYLRPNEIVSAGFVTWLVLAGVETCCFGLGARAAGKETGVEAWILRWLNLLGFAYAAGVLLYWAIVIPFIVQWD